MMIVVVASLAGADDVPCQDFEPEHELIFHLGASYDLMLAHDKETDINRHSIGLVPRLSYNEVLIFEPFIRLTRETLDLREPKNLPADASLLLSWQPSLGFRVQLTFPTQSWLEASLFVEFERSLNKKETTLRSLDIKEPEGSPIVYDDYINETDITIKRDWQRWLVGVRLKGRFGRFHPFVDFGRMSLTGQLYLSFAPEASQLLDMADIHPDDYYDIDLETAYYAMGTEIILPHDFRIHLSVTFLPACGEYALFSGVGVTVPIHRRSW